MDTVLLKLGSVSAWTPASAASWRPHGWLDPRQHPLHQQLSRINRLQWAHQLLQRRRTAARSLTASLPSTASSGATTWTTRARQMPAVPSALTATMRPRSSTIPARRSSTIRFDGNQARTTLAGGQERTRKDDQLRRSGEGTTFMNAIEALYQDRARSASTTTPVDRNEVSRAAGRHKDHQLRRRQRRRDLLRRWNTIGHDQLRQRQQHFDFR